MKKTKEEMGKEEKKQSKAVFGRYGLKDNRNQSAQFDFHENPIERVKRQRNFCVQGEIIDISVWDTMRRA